MSRIKKESTTGKEIETYRPVRFDKVSHLLQLRDSFLQKLIINRPSTIYPRLTLDLEHPDLLAYTNDLRQVLKNSSKVVNSTKVEDTPKILGERGLVTYSTPEYKGCTNDTLLALSTPTDEIYTTLDPSDKFYYQDLISEPLEITFNLDIYNSNTTEERKEELVNLLHIVYPNLPNELVKFQLIPVTSVDKLVNYLVLAPIVEDVQGLCTYTGHYYILNEGLLIKYQTESNFQSIFNLPEFLVILDSLFEQGKPNFIAETATYLEARPSTIPEDTLEIFMKVGISATGTTDENSYTGFLRTANLMYMEKASIIEPLFQPEEQGKQHQQAEGTKLAIEHPRTVEGETINDLPKEWSKLEGVNKVKNPIYLSALYGRAEEHIGFYKQDKLAGLTLEKVLDNKNTLIDLKALEQGVILKLTGEDIKQFEANYVRIKALKNHDGNATIQIQPIYLVTEDSTPMDITLLEDQNTPVEYYTTGKDIDFYLISKDLLFFDLVEKVQNPKSPIKVKDITFAELLTKVTELDNTFESYEGVLIETKGYLQAHENLVFRKIYLGDNFTCDFKASFILLSTEFTDIEETILQEEIIPFVNRQMEFKDELLDDLINNLFEYMTSDEQPEQPEQDELTKPIYDIKSSTEDEEDKINRQITEMLRESYHLTDEDIEILSKKYPNVKTALIASEEWSSDEEEIQLYGQNYLNKLNGGMLGLLFQPQYSHIFVQNQKAIGVQTACNLGRNFSIDPNQPVPTTDMTFKDLNNLSKAVSKLSLLRKNLNLFADILSKTSDNMVRFDNADSNALYSLPDMNIMKEGYWSLVLKYASIFITRADIMNPSQLASKLNDHILEHCVNSDQLKETLEGAMLKLLETAENKGYDEVPVILTIGHQDKTLLSGTEDTNESEDLDIDPYDKLVKQTYLVVFKPIDEDHFEVLIYLNTTTDGKVI